MLICRFSFGSSVLQPGDSVACSTVISVYVCLLPCLNDFLFDRISEVNPEPWEIEAQGRSSFQEASDQSQTLNFTSVLCSVS